MLSATKYSYCVGLAVLCACFAVLKFDIADGAETQCHYSTDYGSNCQKAIDDYFRKTLNRNSDSYSDVNKRVKSGRETLRECSDCTWEHINKGVGNGNSSNDEED